MPICQSGVQFLVRFLRMLTFKSSQQRELHAELPKCILSWLELDASNFDQVCSQMLNYLWQGKAYVFITSLTKIILVWFYNYSFLTKRGP